MKTLLASLILLVPLVGFGAKFERFAFRLVEYSIGAPVGIYDVSISGTEGKIRKVSPRPNETKVVLEKDISKDLVEAFREMLQPGKFVRLKQSYVNPRVFDGFEYTFLLNLPSKKYEVFVSNVQNEYFNQIFDAVNAVFLEDGVINYISQADEIILAVELDLEGEQDAGSDVNR